MSDELWLVGAGNMGGAMLRGWIADGIDPATISVIDPMVEDLPAGINWAREFPRDASPETLVLAVKPQQLVGVSEQYRARSGAPRVVLSILAGVEVTVLKPAFAAQHVVRAMPNLPVSIGKGVTVLYSPDDDAAVRKTASALVAPLGLVEWIEDEGLFDAVTALSGSGPGFVFRFIEAMAEAGATLGLPAEQALRLARATVEGAAQLAAQSSEDPAVLADRVASPGGTTREGLNVLDGERALKNLIARTLSAAARRNAELAAAARS